MARSHVPDELGARIKALRRESGITQMELSRRSGLFQTYLSRIEGGIANPTLDALVALARALDVEPSELLDGADHGAQSAAD